MTENFARYRLNNSEQYFKKKDVDMDFNEQRVRQAADDIYNAWLHGAPIDPLTDNHPMITIADAYAIQRMVVERRIAAGEKIVGKKIGVTSKAVMSMLGVYEPDFGYLLDGMAYGTRQTIDAGSLIQPKAEGEIAFLLKSDLMGPGVTSADVLRATEGVMPCFEIVDSRIKNWKIKIQDTVADNASCGVFVLGDALIDPREFDFQFCGMVLELNGEVVATGAGAAALGSPVNAVAWLANTLGRLGTPLKAGEVILSGALAAMAPVKAGDNLRMTIGGLGGCSIRFS